ncbi:hypothetical protein ACFWBV_15560 [Streptomyces sp. NPDC060030]|uniref:hypothetical protein n=1 Tax=Streptomyces sp. NPDC060030 TaxID=3347042 RepID=UPI0036AF0EB1
MSPTDASPPTPAPTRSRRLRVVGARLRALAWKAVKLAGEEAVKGFGNKAGSFLAVAVAVVILAMILGISPTTLLRAAAEKALGLKL